MPNFKSIIGQRRYRESKKYEAAHKAALKRKYGFNFLIPGTPEEDKLGTDFWEDGVTSLDFKIVHGNICGVQKRMLKKETQTEFYVFYSPQRKDVLKVFAPTFKKIATPRVNRWGEEYYGLNWGVCENIAEEPLTP